MLIPLTAQWSQTPQWRGDQGFLEEGARGLQSQKNYPVLQTPNAKSFPLSTDTITPAVLPDGILYKPCVTTGMGLSPGLLVNMFPSPIQGQQPVALWLRTI